jgi:uncharacterized membrane protein YeiH
MPLNFFETIDILGTLAFAISGTSAAMQKKLDVFGVIIIAFVTSIGGGTLRDILIGNTPVGWLKNITIINVILIGSILTIIMGRYVSKLNYTLFVFDSFGLALATIIGIQKGQALGFLPSICIALGIVTGCFGGVIRDVLLNEIPLVFRKEIYASVGILGGVIFYLLLFFKIHNTYAQVVSMLFIVIMRVFVVKYSLSLPSIYTKTDNKSK